MDVTSNSFSGNPWPLVRSPDSFRLSLPTEVAGTSVRPFVSPWGETAEMLFFSNDVLLGRSVPGPAGQWGVDLAPRLDRHRHYPWPDPYQFFNEVLSLTLRASAAVLWCERDTDQAPLGRLGDEGELSSGLGAVLRYCLGQADECPSFRFEAMVRASLVKRQASR